MAHLHSNHSNVARGMQKEFYGRYRGVKSYYFGSISNSWKTPYQDFVRFTNQTTKSKKNRAKLVYCCSLSSTSSGPQASLVAGKQEPIEICENKKLQFGCLVNDVHWQVRRMVETEDEMREVAAVQAEAFHEPVILFDDLFFDFFKAEVLSGLLYRLKNSSPDRYACLVAEPEINGNESEKEVVGVVDVTVMDDASVLQHLPPGSEEYLYVSGIAVLKKFRRQKVATALLKACDILSAIWGSENLVLRAYEDDYGARKLYSTAGYRIVSADPPWLSWIGRRRRVLMVKQAGRLQ